MRYKDYYAILGIARHAAPARIEDAWLRQIREIKDRDSDIVSAIRARDLDHAHAILSVPATRAAYDELGIHAHGEDFLPSGRWMRRFGPGIDPRDLPQDLNDVFLVLAPTHVEPLAVPMHQPADHFET